MQDCGMDRSLKSRKRGLGRSRKEEERQRFPTGNKEVKNQG